MTDKTTPSNHVPADGRIAIKLQRDKSGQFFDLPTGWKFTNDKVTPHKTEGALVLMPVRSGKLKLPQPIKKATDYPKTSVKT